MANTIESCGGEEDVPAKGEVYDGEHDEHVARVDDSYLNFAKELIGSNRDFSQLAEDFDVSIPEISVGSIAEAARVEVGVVLEKLFKRLFDSVEANELSKIGSD